MRRARRAPKRSKLRNRRRINIGRNVAPPTHYRTVNIRPIMENSSNGRVVCPHRRKYVPSLMRTAYNYRLRAFELPLSLRRSYLQGYTKCVIRFAGQRSKYEKNTSVYLIYYDVQSVYAKVGCIFVILINTKSNHSQPFHAFARGK